MAKVKTLSPVECDLIRARIWDQPPMTMRELVDAADLHRLNLKGSRDQMRELCQHPTRPRTDFDLERAETRLRDATFIADFVKKRAEQPPERQQQQQPEPEPFLDL